jgi:hypothetical protein
VGQLVPLHPGQGNTGHCFNDFNHVDATTMTLDMSDNENRGQVDVRLFTLNEVDP